MSSKRLAIIGGGASAFFCAATLADAGIKDKISVTIFEQLPKPMLKLLATGGGRCNLTNNIDNTNLLVKQYPRGEKFLYSIFKQFSPAHMIEWLKHNKVLTYTDNDNCVFLKSDSATTLTKMFLRKAQELEAILKVSTAIDNIEYKDKKFHIKYNENEEVFDIVLIATGGNKNIKKHIQTINGYHLAEKLGHTIIQPKEVLGGLIINDSNIANLSGITLENITITARQNETKIAQTTGDLIFTHKGISGPAVLNLSSLLADYDLSKTDISACIKTSDFSDPNKADLELQNKFKESSNKNIQNILSIYYPRNIALYILTANNIDPEKKANSITKLERTVISKNLFEFRLPIRSIDNQTSIVTAGGIDLKEINSKTMGSKKTDNLYFTGEILNVDGFCGGYNLQFAWSSGYIAALSIANSL